MKYLKIISILTIVSHFFIASTPANAAALSPEAKQLHIAVTNIIRPLMQKHHIPGVAIGLTINNKNYFFNYGFLSKDHTQPVTQQTLFEIASITKTFTAVLAEYLALNGKISLNKPVAYYLPELTNPAFQKITLFNLLTHTSGLPLFEPVNVTTTQQFLNYLNQWQPTAPIGSRRVYSNVGFGLLGIVLGRAMNQSYQQLVMNEILQPLKLEHSFFVVPEQRQLNYAQGYTKNNEAIRMPPEMLLPAASGLKSCTQDLINYVKANMAEMNLPEKLQQAILATHIGYYKTDDVIQDLGWEQIAYQASLQKMIAANSKAAFDEKAIFDATAEAEQDVIINKTGTGIKGNFASYILFVPSKRIGVVILANKFYPLEERVVIGRKLLIELAARH